MPEPAGNDNGTWRISAVLSFSYGICRRSIRFITDRAVPSFEQKGTGSIIAAGLLGGEAIVGVIIALIIAVQIMA